MSRGIIRVIGKRRLLAASLAIITLFTVVIAVVLMSFHTKTALGSGTGGGGCVSTTGSACTFKDGTAFVRFSNVSDDGCIFTDAVVSAYDNLTNPGQTATQRAELYISKWDNCSETSLLSVSNYDPTTGESQFTGTIQFSSDLSSATVNGTAAMYDWNSGSLSYSAIVNLTFKGYGSTFTMVDNHRLQAPGYVENAHFTGKSRSAEASGTFTDPDGNNAAAVSTTNAVLADSTGGTVRIYKG